MLQMKGAFTCVFISCTSKKLSGREGRRWGVVGGHVSSPQVRCQSLFLMTSLPGYCTPCLWLNIHCPTHLVPHTPAQASRGVSPKSRELREVKGTKTVYTAWSTFTRNRSRWARPNIWRFRNLSRFTWPSVVPLLQGKEQAARTAA